MRLVVKIDCRDLSVQDPMRGMMKTIQREKGFQRERYDPRYKPRRGVAEN